MHTPGPYREGKDGGSIVSDSNEGLGWQDAETTAFYGGYVVAETVAICNKPLFIAAPDLLDACKQARSHLENGGMSFGLLKALQDAIAKAEKTDM